MADNKKPDKDKSKNSEELDELLNRASKDEGSDKKLENTESKELEDEGVEIVYTSGNKNIEDLVESRILETEMRSSYLNYAMSVIVSRALPDVRDGLKPVHRRIMYAMHKLGLTPGSKHIKSGRIVGDVLGKYHPHGDQSIYNSLVRLAQDFSLRYPLVDGQGNFGSIDGDPPAAMRYTESRMAKPAPFLLADIEKDTVEFTDNYDGSFQEPTVLPTMLPNLLINGQTGIAVGMATEIPPHNLGEVVKGLIKQLHNPEITIDELAEVIKGPDLPTGAALYGREGILEAFKTGRGKVMCRSTAELEENRIIITEIPYQVNKATMLEKIATLVRDKRIDGIKDIRDESNKKGIRVVFDTKRDASPEVVLNQLYKLSELQKSIHYNMVALVNRGRQPKTVNLKEIFTEFLAHRDEVITNRTKFDLKKAEDRLHILEGLLIALDDIDRVISIIRGSDSKEEAGVELQKVFKLSEIQTEAILQMRLQTLAGLERQKIKDEYDGLIELIKELKEIIDSYDVRKGIIEEELLDIDSKLASPRRTKLISKDITDYSKEDLIEEQEVIVQLTKEQYVKWLPADTFRVQNRGGTGKKGINTKNEDFVVQSFYANTHDFVYAFTNTGRVFKTRVFELPQGSRTSRGQNIVNYLNLQNGEQVQRILPITREDESDKNGSLFFATKKGIVKRTLLNDYKNIRTSGIIAIGIKDGDQLFDVLLSKNQNDKVVLSGDNGKTVIFDREEVRAMGRSASGVKGINLKNEDLLIGMQIIYFEFATTEEEEADESSSKKKQFPTLLVVTENGFGKQTYLGGYRKTKRAASGVKTMKVTKKTGKPKVIAINDGESEELFLTTKNGISIKVDPQKISHLGRSTQGVKVIKLNKDDALVSGGMA